MGEAKDVMRGSALNNVVKVAPPKIHSALMMCVSLGVSSAAVTSKEKSAPRPVALILARASLVMRAKSALKVNVAQALTVPLWDALKANDVSRQGVRLTHAKILNAVSEVSAVRVNVSSLALR